MNDVTQSPYAGFLEALCESVVELKPTKIAVTGILPDGNAFTGIFGDCSPYDLATMAFHLQTDAMMEIVKANAKDILKAAQEEEGEE